MKYNLVIALILVIGSVRPQNKTKDPCLCGIDSIYLEPSSGLILQSPKFPKNYCPNLNCEWTVYAKNPESHLEAEIVVFETEQCCDILTIYDEEKLNISLRGIESGRSFISTSNKMIFNFITNADNETAGFSINIHIKDDNTRDEKSLRAIGILIGLLMLLFLLLLILFMIFCEWKKLKDDSKGDKQENMRAKGFSISEFEKSSIKPRSNTMWDYSKEPPPTSFDMTPYKKKEVKDGKQSPEPVPEDPAIRPRSNTMWTYEPRARVDSFNMCPGFVDDRRKTVGRDVHFRKKDDDENVYTIQKDAQSSNVPLAGSFNIPPGSDIGYLADKIDTNEPIELKIDESITI